MRILIVNYRYFISGGPEKYLFNIMELLKKHGHEVIPFSVRSAKNVPTEYEKFFVDPIGGMDDVYYEDYKKTPANIWKMFSRSVYSFEVKHALMKEIRDVKPDLVYVLQCVNKLSPSVIRAAKQMGVPVVYRLSDYQFMCPRFDFLRDDRVCEECVSKGLSSCIKHRCVKGSLAASLVRVFGMKVHRMIHVYDDVDAFITPSAFLKSKLVENGYDAGKIHNILTFSTKENSTDDNPATVGDYGVFFGRLAPLKDIPTLLKAYEILKDHRLKIVGDTSVSEAQPYLEYAKEHNISNAEFTGFKSGDELSGLIRNARFSILSSASYDNLPNSALESMLFGKPIIAADIGSLTELVDDGVNGYLYKPCDPEALAEAIRKMDVDDEQVRAMGAECIRIFRERFAPEKHYEQLMAVFESVVSGKTSGR